MPAPQLGLTARAIVDQVLDGDTINVLLAIPVSVRMKGVWAPETRGDEREEGERFKAILERMAPVGSEVHLQIPTGHVDAMAGVFSFGRAVGELWRVGDDDSLNLMMIQELQAAGYKGDQK